MGDLQENSIVYGDVHSRRERYMIKSGLFNVLAVLRNICGLEITFLSLQWGGISPCYEGVQELFESAFKNTVAQIG